MIIRHFNESILNTPLNHIAHGVNCQNTMGSGVAKVLFDKWPDVKEQYHTYMNDLNSKGRTPEQYLGTPMPPIEVEPGKFVHNLFTQLNYGYDGQKYVNYYAVVTAMKFMVSVNHDMKVAIPKIGCGLAGGSWFFMEQLLKDAFDRYDNFEIWVYDTNKPAKPDFV